MQIPIITLAIILFFNKDSRCRSPAPQHSAEHKETASLRFICYRKQKEEEEKKRSICDRKKRKLTKILSSFGILSPYIIKQI